MAVGNGHGSKFILLLTFLNMRTCFCKYQVQLVLVSQDVSLECRIAPQLHTLLWKYNDKYIDLSKYNKPPKNAKTATLNITNVGFSDAGNYTCMQVRNEGRILTTTFKLQVQGFPTVSVSQNTTVEGDCISATCCIAYSMNLEEIVLLWYIGNETITGSFVKQFQEQTLQGLYTECSNVTFTSLRRFIDQNLQCIAQNELQVSTATQLQVYWPPQLHILVNNKEIENSIDVIKGSEHTFKCISSNSNPEADLKMTINTANTTVSSSIQAKNEDGTHYSENSLSFVIQENITLVECIALGKFNKSGARKSIKLFAYDLPRLGIALNNDEVIDTVEVIKGQKYNLTCKARFSKKNFDLRWTINNASIGINANSLSYEDTNGHLPANLHISHVFQSNSTIVVCSADGNSESFEVTKRIEVLAYDVPDLNIIVNTQSAVGSIVIYGDPVVNLTCIAANASSQLAVDWMKHGKRLEQQNERMITRFVENQNSIMTSNVSIVLQEHFTNVSCVSSGESELQRQVTSLVIQYYENPNLTLYYKEDISPVSLHVYVGTRVRLTCNASNVESFDSFDWRVAGLCATQGENYFTKMVNGSNEALSATSLDMAVQRAEVVEVTCVALDKNNTVRDTSVTLIIEFHDLPEISITLDGVNTTDGIIQMRYGTNHSVTCNVKGDILLAYILYLSISATPETNITNGSQVIERRGKYNNVPLTLTFQARSENVYAECKIESPVEMRNISTHLQIATFASPEIIIVFKEEIMKTNISIAPDITHKLTCLAMGGKPNVTLVWLTKSSEVFEVNSTTYAQRNDQDQYFDIFNDLYFRLETEIAQVTCTADSELEEQRCNSTVTLLMKPQAESTDLHSWNLNKIIITPALILAAVLVVTFIIYRNVRRFRPFSILDTRIAAITRPDTETICTSLDDTIAGGEHMAACSAQIDQTGTTSANRKQSMALPKVPRENRRSYGDYASLRIKSLHAKIYKRHEVCFVLHLKKGMLLDRWMGTIVNKNGNKKSVFVTSVKEDRQVKREYHWDMYVQKVMEMPHHRALIKTVGLCIDRVNIFLLQNYQPVGTLDDWMVGKQQTVSSFTTVEVLEYANQIVAGMEMIVTYGFLHPGLSMKKILLTERKCCKIYDFCLKEDVLKKVDLIKGKENRPTLPPETEERNEYTWASDSWSVAICICDVFAYAHGIKVDIDGETEDGQRDLPIDVQNSLQECYSKDPMNRLPLRNLKESLSTWLSEEGIKLMPDDDSESSSCSSPSVSDDEDGYMSMSAHVTVDRHDIITTSL
ncbi:uncharacterized protein [Apostichopus japonicus]|uniref:uncharacterized protein isoform X1 n=1 Tax=Stichopus japonicus TaxID=307972 RepID=UPI003AB7C7B7